MSERAGDKPLPTPRTEAMIESCGDYEKAYHYNGRFAEFARGLERELAASEHDRAALHRACEGYRKIVDGAAPSSIGPRPERVDTAELVLELQTWAQNESRRPDGQGNFYLVDLLEKAVTALAVPSARGTIIDGELVKDEKRIAPYFPTWQMKEAGGETLLQMVKEFAPEIKGLNAMQLAEGIYMEMLRHIPGLPYPENIRATDGGAKP